MGKRAKLGARSRMVLLGAIVASSAVLVPAHAAPPPPTNVNTPVANDGWINADEATRVVVRGNYDDSASPAITEIRVRFVIDGTCDVVPGGANTLGPAHIVSAGGGGTFGNGSFETDPIDVTAAGHGTTICPVARTFDGTLGPWTPGFDSDGNPVLAVLDLTIPDAPVIITPGENELVPAHFPVVGTAEAGTRIEVFDVTDISEPPLRIGVGQTNPSNDWTADSFIGRSGARQIVAQASDPAGNVSAFSAVRTLDVDAALPTVYIENPAGGVVPTIFLPGDEVVLEGTAEDIGSGILAVEVHIWNLLGQHIAERQIKPGQPGFTCKLGCPVNLGVEWEWKPNLGVGLFHVKVWAIDVAGNRTLQPDEAAFLKLG